MLNTLRKLRGWAGVCRSLHHVHWGSFPVFGKEAWKREHVGGFVSKLARFPLPQDARCILDVGANIGTFSSAALAYCPQAQIWAFEPSSAAAAELTKLVGPDPRLKLFRSAVGDKPGKATLLLSENLFSSSLESAGDRGRALLGSSAQLTGASEEVPVTTLDAWSVENKIGEIDLLKVDVEGFEPQVIEGGKDTIRKAVHRIIIEVSLARLGFEGAMELLKRIESLGFELVNLDDVSRVGNASGICTQFDAWFQRGEASR